MIETLVHPFEEFVTDRLREARDRWLACVDESELFLVSVRVDDYPDLDSLNLDHEYRMEHLCRDFVSQPRLYRTLDDGCATWDVAELACVYPREGQTFAEFQMLQWGGA